MWRTIVCSTILPRLPPKSPQIVVYCTCLHWHPTTHYWILVVAGSIQCICKKIDRWCPPFLWASPYEIISCPIVFQFFSVSEALGPIFSGPPTVAQGWCRTQTLMPGLGSRDIQGQERWGCDDVISPNLVREKSSTFDWAGIQIKNWRSGSWFVATIRKHTNKIMRL